MVIVSKRSRGEMSLNFVAKEGVAVLDEDHEQASARYKWKTHTNKW